MKKVTFTFGRFNPPTTGHALLVKKLKGLGRGGDVLLFSSHSRDNIKNPLPHKIKVKYLRRFFGKIVVDANVRTVFEIANELHKRNYTHVNMVVGSDRVKEFENLLKKYNGVKARHGFYKFEEINILSAGERDPDADDVTGMSASKMRAFAEKGDFDSFKQGVPSRNARDAESLYNDIRKGMGIVEERLPDYMIQDLITEGVYDPGIFKAVFLMGGPGSGKSTVVDELALKNLGLKMVNTDRAFEIGLKKAGLSLDLRGKSDDEYAHIRKKAKDVTARGMEGYINGRLGLIFDTTAANKKKIIQYKEMLDKLGYEYKMVFVNTSLDTALERNRARPRKLRDDIVSNDWHNVQKNMSEFKRAFKKDFIEIRNDDTFEALKKKAGKLYSKMLTWTSQFPGNTKAQTWRETELLKKKAT